MRAEKKDTIMVTRPSMPPYSEYIQEIKDLWESRWLTNEGMKHQELESKLKEYLRVPNLTLFANGHCALEAALAVFGLHGEVITTPFTFASTTHAIVRNGLEPVFCDCKKTDYTIDVDKIEALITEKTSAIVPVHVYGNVCDTEKLDRIGEKYNIRIIYDAAHAFGVEKNGVGIGNFGDASMFSFHATKVFNTAEGGALTYKDGTIKQAFSQYKNFGFNEQGSVENVGINAKMNEFEAALGICNLRYLPQEIEKRRVIYERYTERLEGRRGITLNKIPPNVRSNYSYYPVLFEGAMYARDAIAMKLNRESVFPRKYFYPLTSDFTCNRNNRTCQTTPNAKYISEHILCLPLYADLSIADVDRICSIIVNE